MIYGIKFERNGELYTKIDLAEYVRVEDKTANIDLPERARPIITDNSHLKILYAEFNPRLIYRGNAEGTIKGWEYLEFKKVPLGMASTRLAISEIYEILALKVWPTIPLVILPAELAFLIDFLHQRRVKNLDDRIHHEIRKKIRGDIKSANKNLKNNSIPSIAVYPLKKTVSSIVSELWACRELVEKGFDVAFNPRKEGPDLYINGTKLKFATKLEVTRKSGRLNIDEYMMWMKISQKNPTNSWIHPYPEAILITLSLALVETLEEELKQGDIVFVDISSFLEGMILLGLKSLSKRSKELELDSAMIKALSLVDNGKNAIVFYSRASDTSAAMCVDAEIIMSLIDNIRTQVPDLVSFWKFWKKYPYTLLKVTSDMVEMLDKLEKSEKARK